MINAKQTVTLNEDVRDTQYIKEVVTNNGIMRICQLCGYGYIGNIDRHIKNCLLRQQNVVKLIENPLSENREILATVLMCFIGLMFLWLL